MYTAQYVEKKLYGRLGAEHYSDKWPPFQLQSQSLGRDYFRTYSDDIVRTGNVYIPGANGEAGRLAPIPRTLLEKLKLTDPDSYAKIKKSRRDYCDTSQTALLSDLRDLAPGYRRDASRSLINEARASLAQRDKL